MYKLCNKYINYNFTIQSFNEILCVFFYFYNIFACFMFSLKKLQFLRKNYKRRHGHNFFFFF